MDKNKIIEAAAKLVAKGAYDKAIKEYQKVLEADPKDVRILQKMGELFQKKNDNAQAAHYFTKVAESYSADGFFLKAVALYKQVLKLNPNLIDVNLKLAELHQQLGLMSEAMGYFQTVANAYDKQGNTKSSLDTLKKMVDLDPDNVASRIKLAELYAREKMEKEAVQEFKRAAEYLKRNNRTDDYLRVAERLSALETDNLELARELASSYLAKGDQKRALAKLQACFKADPKDVETLNLLAQAFKGLGQTSKTVSVYKELAKIYAERNRSDDAEKIWQKIAQLDPADPELAARRGGSAPAAPAPEQPRRPSQVSSPPPSGQHRAASAPAASHGSSHAAPAAASAAAGQQIGKDQLAKLLTETDVYVKYGLHDKALEHLRKIFSVDPENLEAHEKAYNIYLSANNHQQASEQLINVLRLCARNGEVQRAQPYLATLLQQNPGHPDVPTLLAVLRPGGAEAAPAAVEPLGEEAILVDSSDEEIIVADAPEDALAPQPEDLALASSSEPVGDDVVSDDEIAPVPMGEPLGDDVVATDSGHHAVFADEPVVAADNEFEPDTGEVAIPAGDLDDEPKTQTNMVVPTELLEQGDFMGTQPALKMDRPQEWEAKPGRVEKADKRPAKKAPPPPVEEVEEVMEEAVEAPPEDEPAQEECQEAGFFLDQGLTSEAREILETVLIAYPGHERATELMGRLEAMEASQGSARAAPADEPITGEDASPPPVAPLEDGAEGGHDAFDLAAELADELGELGGTEEAPPSAAGDDFQYSVEEVFSEFKKGLEKVVKPEDVETHYDLGIAYKEMGLTDDAIGEFNVALQGCRGKKKEIDCLTMVAMLQGMKGDHAAAIEALKTALGSEHAQGESAKALRFELGAAWEAMGNAGKALFHYQRVAQLDAKYRDVGKIVERLSGSGVNEEEDSVRVSAPKKGDTGARPAAGPPPKRPMPGSNGANGGNGANGAGGNGTHTKGDGGGGKGGSSESKPPESSPKARKVGYI